MTLNRWWLLVDYELCLINTSLDLWGLMQKKCLFSLTFSFLFIIEPMKESINKYVNQWRESVRILSYSLFNTFQNQSSSLYCDQSYHFHVAMGQRPRGVVAKISVLVWEIGWSVFTVISSIKDFPGGPLVSS